MHTLHHRMHLIQCIQVRSTAHTLIHNRVGAISDRLQQHCSTQPDLVSLSDSNLRTGHACQRGELLEGLLCKGDVNKTSHRVDGGAGQVGGGVQDYVGKHTFLGHILGCRLRRLLLCVADHHLTPMCIFLVLADAVALLFTLVVIGHTSSIHATAIKLTCHHRVAIQQDLQALYGMLSGLALKEVSHLPPVGLLHKCNFEATAMGWVGACDATGASALPPKCSVQVLHHSFCPIGRPLDELVHKIATKLSSSFGQHSPAYLTKLTQNKGRALGVVVEGHHLAEDGE
mmetsp:Transcript_33799/g.54773  ORF Transcript_33799/g.54773 Transcript_33799/m.54773 type:complete len:286 (-) Transcript_33799:1712-2569(-)